MKVRIYVEGGSAGIAKTNCRKAFSLFLAKRLPAGSFQVIASGDRQKAYDDFCTALIQHAGEYVVLLVDSEEPVMRAPWEHLAQRTGDGWQRPAGATDDQVQLMVQVMESWFLADPEALVRYYGQHFHRASLPRNPNIEQVAKLTVYKALEKATRKTQKREYHKTRHAFELLESLDPALVRAACPHADRLFLALEAKTGTI